VNELALAIFTRAPIPGKTKTRLIRAYGAQGAADIHSQLLEKTIATAVTLNVPMTLWVAGDSEHHVLKSLVATYALSLAAQQGETLGDRMAYALKQMRCGANKVLLVGSDCFTHTPVSLREAAGALDSAQMVFTPAQDGGYVLVGATGVVNEAAFDGIEWGTSQVMRQSRERLSGAGITWTELETTWDVDEPEDVVRTGLMPKR
jgi:uncharacterized protein